MNTVLKEFKTVQEARDILKSRKVRAVFVWANLYGDDGAYVKVSKTEIQFLLGNTSGDTFCSGTLDEAAGDMYFASSCR